MGRRFDPDRAHSREIGTGIRNIDALEIHNDYSYLRGAPPITKI